MQRLGDILDQSISLGANQADGVSFGVSNREAHEDEARKLAMKNARRRAELYATAAEAQLGPVLRVSDKSFNDSNIFGIERLSGYDRPSVPIEVGSQRISVSIEVTYSIR